MFHATPDRHRGSTVDLFVRDASLWCITMSRNAQSASTNGVVGEKSYFEQQREALVGEIAIVR